MGESATEKATLGGGCFWCLEAIFRDIEGVKKVVSGYAGGHVRHPTYQQVCEGTTGHAEVVQLTYDPGTISYRDLLRIFFSIHDPTTPDRQGGDVGTQYRSIILFHTPEQQEIARAVIDEVEREALWEDPIVTEVAPLKDFYEAEAYHHRYFERNPNQPYCRMVIAPKVAKFRKTFTDRLVSSRRISGP